MSIGEKPILSVIESIPDRSLDLHDTQIYDPSFWLPYLPLKAKSFLKTDISSYSFHIQDTIILDPTETLKTDYDAKGTLDVHFDENYSKAGAKWTFHINIEDPNALVSGSILAKNNGSALKIGIFIYQLDSTAPQFYQFGQDAIFFAIRWYLRKLLRSFDA